MDLLTSKEMIAKVKYLEEKTKNLEKELRRWKPKNLVEEGSYSGALYCTVVIEKITLLESKNPADIIDHELQHIKEELLKRIQRS